MDEVVRAARRGERWALESLFTSYWPVLLDYYRAWGWGNAAEELAMTVWVGLLDGGLARLEGESEQALRRFLFTVARRRLIDHHRRGLRRQTAPRVPEPAGEPVAYGDRGDPAEVVGERLDSELPRFATCGSCCRRHRRMSCCCAWLLA